MFLVSYDRSGVPTLDRSAIRTYLLALLAVTAAVLGRQALDPYLGDSQPFVTLLLAMIFAAWYGRVGALLLATLSGAVACWYLFVPPRYSFKADAPDEWVGLALFLAAAAVLAAATEALRRELRNAAADLAAARGNEEEARFQVVHLRIANENLSKSESRAVFERNRLEQRVRTSEERLSAAEQAARFCIFDWDLKSGAIFAGGDLAQVFGISREKWAGYPSFLEAIHREDRDAVEREIARCLEKAQPLQVEFRASWPDGSIHWVAARGSIICEQGRPVRVVGVYQDITQRKSTEQALVRNEKLAAAGRLAATIAHEINNPLTAVTNLLYILKADTSLSQSGREYLGLAEQELSRVAHIARQTLGFYRDSAEPVRLHVHDLLEEVLALYARNMPGHIEVERQYEPAPPIQALRGEMTQVFSNLVSNALYALNDGGGRLTVRVRVAGRTGRPGVQVEVGDNGPGIPGENLERLFEPFFTTKKDVGIGLGLWVVKQIVEKHGGTIAVESSTDPERHGTWFSLFLPATALEKAEKSSAA